MKEFDDIKAELDARLDRERAAKMTQDQAREALTKRVQAQLNDIILPEAKACADYCAKIGLCTVEVEVEGIKLTARSPLPEKNRYIVFEILFLHGWLARRMNDNGATEIMENMGSDDALRENTRKVIMKLAKAAAEATRA